MNTGRRMLVLLLSLGIASGATGQNQLRIDSLNRCLASVGDTGRVMTLLALSGQYTTVDSTKAIRYARQAGSLAATLRFDKGRVLANLRRADAHFFNHNNAVAQVWFARGLTLAEATGQRRYQAVFQQRLGDVWAELGDYERAVRYYFRSLRLFEQLNQPRDVAISCASLGVTFGSLNEPEKALLYFNRALPIYERLNNKLSLVNTYNNMGNLHQEAKRYAEAASLFRRCIRLAQDADLTAQRGDLVSGAYQNLGNGYYKQRQYRRALAYYDSALTLQRSLNDKPNLTGTLINEAYCQLALNDTKKSLLLLEEASVLVQALKSQPLRVEALSLYADVYQQRGDYQKALAYRNQWVSSKDSLFNQVKNQQIQELQIRYETEKKEEQIALLTEQSALRTRLNYAGLGILITVVGLLGLLYNRYQLQRRLFTQRERLLTEETQRNAAELKLAVEERRRIQTELDYKQRELTSATMYLFEKNEWLTAVKTQLRQLNGHSSDDQLRKLTKTIDQNLELDNNWNRFKLHFDQVYPGFFDHLHTQFPGLSPNELKHCAYIRINLSAKEVATLMNITPDSVKMARYRIKKRLGLQPNDPLGSYLSGF